jgi:hypothetical protein
MTVKKFSIALTTESF